MRRTVSFYDPTTGDLVGRTLSGPADWVEKNIPAGLAAIDGLHDHRTMRVNLETLTVEPKP